MQLKNMFFNWSPPFTHLPWH